MAARILLPGAQPIQPPGPPPMQFKIMADKNTRRVVLITNRPDVMLPKMADGMFQPVQIVLKPGAAIDMGKGLIKGAATCSVGLPQDANGAKAKPPRAEIQQIVQVVDQGSKFAGMIGQVVKIEDDQAELLMTFPPEDDPAPGENSVCLCVETVPIESLFPIGFPPHPWGPQEDPKEGNPDVPSVNPK